MPREAVPDGYAACPFCANTKRFVILSRAEDPWTPRHVDDLFRVQCEECGAWGPGRGNQPAARAVWGERYYTHLLLAKMEECMQIIQDMRKKPDR